MTRTAARAPYRSGDKVMMLRDDTNGTTWGPLTIDRVVPLSDGQTWRICCTRNNGTPVESYVGRNGRDRNDYTQPMPKETAR